jgi:hypothetical protein
MGSMIDILNEEDVNNLFITIQPTLMSYTFNIDPPPVLLDSVSIKRDVILLDTFSFSYPHFPRRNGSLVEKGRLPGARRVRELQGAFREPCHRCPGAMILFCFLTYID